jgi:hypothetical protein
LIVSLSPPEQRLKHRIEPNVATTGWRAMGSTTIQTDFGEGKYPIGRFILERARRLGMSRSDLVRRLHYRDIGSGHKALPMLLTGAVSHDLAKHLAEPPEVDDALLGSVIAASAG